MATIELKGKLLHQISKIEDPEFFEALKLFLDLKLEHKIYQTSNTQKLIVEEGLNQFERGEGISDGDFDMKMQKWLDEK
jgi:hypothetical protein